MTLDTNALLLLMTLLLLAGLVAGVLAGLLGVGGGIVVVPVTYQVLLLAGVPTEHLMHIAVGTSLALIIPGAWRSASGHHARGAVLPWLLRRWWVALVAGVVFGVVLARVLSSTALALIFAAVVLLMGCYLLLAPERLRLGERLPRGPAGAAIPGVIGTVSALMGIGGGSLSVPAMTAYGIPVHQAVGTSAALGLLIAMPGAVGFVLTGWGQGGLPPYSLGYVNIIALACLLPTMLLGVPLGVRLAHLASPRTLRLAFAAFLLLTGLRMALAALGTAQS